VLVGGECRRRALLALLERIMVAAAEVPHH
jgi:hypothetical protein